MAISSPIRVLVVDDSAFIRYTVTKHLDQDPDITVIGTARDGLDALKQAAKLQPDVIVLDVEMPRMDGLEALKQIMTKQPTPVVMLSGLTQRGARTTVQALMRGALDFVPKPDAKVDINTVIQDLASKIKAAVGARPVALQPVETAPLKPPPQRRLLPLRRSDPIIIMGASTGGPRALHRTLNDLTVDLPAGVVIVQHMPPGFTHSLAQRFDKSSPLVVREAVDGDHLARGLALLAPGNFHLLFTKGYSVTLSDGPRRHHVRPALDVTIESAVEHFRNKVIGVVLTGMGEDGLDGARLIKEAGGCVIAEHESTSIVYGMPGSVVKAGLADYVLPLPEIGAKLQKLVGG